VGGKVRYLDITQPCHFSKLREKLLFPPRSSKVFFCVLISLLKKAAYQNRGCRPEFIYTTFPEDSPFDLLASSLSLSAASQVVVHSVDSGYDIIGSADKVLWYLAVGGSISEFSSQVVVCSVDFGCDMIGSTDDGVWYLAVGGSVCAFFGVWLRSLVVY
jgi:hypothetical protein